MSSSVRLTIESGNPDDIRKQTFGIARKSDIKEVDGRYVCVLELNGDTIVKDFCAAYVYQGLQEYVFKDGPPEGKDLFGTPILVPEGGMTAKEGDILFVKK